jgi:hypothetical protein
MLVLGLDGLMSAPATSGVSATEAATMHVAPRIRTILPIDQPPVLCVVARCWLQ